MIDTEYGPGSARSVRRFAGGSTVSVLPLFLITVSATGCGFIGRGDGGLVPALLGLAPPSRSSGSAAPAASASEPAEPLATSAPVSPSVAPSARPQAASARPEPPAPVAALRPNSADEPSVDERLRALRRLRDRHAISEAEYQSRRMRLLEQY